MRTPGLVGLRGAARRYTARTCSARSIICIGRLAKACMACKLLELLLQKAPPLTRLIEGRVLALWAKPRRARWR